MTDHRTPLDHVDRRVVLIGVGTTLASALAGCTAAEAPRTSSLPETGTSGQTSEAEPSASASDDTATESDEEGTGEVTTGEAELDLREANVVGVEFERTDGSYRFSVTLYHDDDGEDGYANWWQVETTDGERIGRRELLHAHSTRPFTRSATIDVPGDVSCVVVRGHDQTHGYGGQMKLVNLASGETAAVDQGPERRAVNPGECP